MTIKKNSAGHAAELKNDRKASVVIARNNNFELLDKNTSFLYISDSRADTALCENNFRNGKLFYEGKHHGERAVMDSELAKLLYD